MKTSASRGALPGALVPSPGFMVRPTPGPASGNPAAGARRGPGAYGGYGLGSSHPARLRLILLPAATHLVMPYVSWA